MTLSLWFVPNTDGDLSKTLERFINVTAPTALSIPQDEINTFPPHVTITSDITLEPNISPQAWLDNIDCSEYVSGHEDIR